MASKNTEKVALLKGGWNAEREVSLESAKGVFAALTSCGFDVHEIEVTRDIQRLIQELKDYDPDVVFLNALHGRYVEDGAIQGLMEMLGYPYTGSDVASSAVAFDKQRSRDAFEHKGVPIPKGEACKAQVFFSQPMPSYPYPFVVKPLNEGSSVGVFIIHTLEGFKDAAQKWTYGNTVLVEEYIPGRELSVALQAGKTLGVLELRPKKGFYDYAAKYTDGLTEHVMPADLSPEDYDAVMTIAESAADALAVSGVSRADIRFDDDRPQGQRAYVLEVNTLPGMTALSIVPEIAAYARITYEQLCEWMVKNPIWPENQSPQKGRLHDDEKQPIKTVRS